jgi:hypothetical protein
MEKSNNKKGKGEQPKSDKGYTPKAGPKSGGTKGKSRKAQKPNNIVTPEEGKAIWKAVMAEKALEKAEARVKSAWDKVSDNGWDLIILHVFATISGFQISSFEALMGEIWSDDYVFATTKEDFHVLKRNFFNKAYSALKGEALIGEEGRQQLSELTNEIWWGGREAYNQNRILNP